MPTAQGSATSLMTDILGAMARTPKHWVVPPTSAHALTGATTPTAPVPVTMWRVAHSAVTLQTTSCRPLPHTNAHALTAATTPTARAAAMM